MRKISIFAIFELHQQYIHQKNAFSKWNSIMGRKNKICKKKMKKIDFFRFLIKNYADQLASTANFLQMVKKISKITLSGLVRRFEMKSHQI